MIIPTKLYIPCIRTPLVSRSMLTKKLEEGLNRALTLVTAPAGYGKTTLLSQWAHTCSTDISWVSLDEYDNQFLHFWSHSLTAIGQTNHSFDEQKVLSYYNNDPSGVSLIASFINELHRLPEKLVLIWDDFHVIENQQILASVAYVLQHLPAHIHLYIASRSLPSLPLARLNTSGELNQLTINDLRFTLAEVEDFFGVHQLRNISPLETANVLERTEGWVAGLRLATITLDRNRNQDKQIPLLTGNMQAFADYFFDEVYTKQPKEMQHFLLKTSILEQLNSALCTAVTKMENSAALLHSLEQEQLFIVPLDEQREWYRYHHLFQQFLQQRLQLTSPEIINQLHIAAGHWFTKKQREHQAVKHYLAGASFENALYSLQKMIPLLQDYERTTLHHWLDQIPSSLLFQTPSLYLINMASLFLSGKIDKATEKYWWAIHRLEEAEHSLSAEEVHLFYAGLSFLVAFRGFLEKDFTTCLEYSKDYLTRDPEGNFMVGFGSNREGYHPVWNIHVSSGHLPKAELVLLDLLKLWSATNNVYFVAHLCIDYGKLLYEWNRLNEAQQYLQQALTIGKTHKNISLVVISSIWLARIYRAKGDWSQGQTLLTNIQKDIHPSSHPQLTKLFKLHQAQLQHMLGMLEQVGAWVSESQLDPADRISFSMIEEYELLVCVLKEKRALEAALHLTNRLLQLAEREKVQTISIRLLLRKSLLLAEQGRDAQSIEILEEALCLGEKDGYLRSFVDEGPSLIPLLAKYIHVRQNNHRRQRDKVSLAYVKKLINLLSLEMSKTKGNVEQDVVQYHAVLQSLTVQEQTILKLIVSGLKNREIASDLDISLSTVKTHINNIYRKLQVNSRFMAVQRVKQWGLFEEKGGDEHESSI